MEKIWEEDNLKKIYNQVKDLKTELLFSGLTVLFKDTADFINSQGFNDQAIDLFREAYLETLNQDRFYWEQFGPELYMGLQDGNLPFGIVKAAYTGNFDLEPLKNDQIILPWTQFPGYCFFKIYSFKVKDIILKGSSLEQEKAKVFECKEPEEQIFPLIEKLSRQSIFGPGFWYPIMLYISLLLFRSRYITLEEHKEGSEPETRMDNIENKFSTFEQKLGDFEKKLSDAEVQIDDLKNKASEEKKIIMPKSSNK